jgi:uncharacterized protein (DUF362 family)
MSIGYSPKAFLRANIQGLFNLFLLSALLATTIYLLHHSPLDKEKLELEYYTLVLLMGFVLAIWTGWYTSSPRVIGLILSGALIGLCTEYTAKIANLWVYESPTAFLAGICIYSQGAVTLFGIVYVVDRIISNHSFSRRTGWINCLSVVVLFFVLFATSAQYLGESTYKYSVIIYYSLLFAAAITLGYCLRFGRLLSIVIAATLGSFIGQYAGGTMANIWVWIPDPTSFPPLYLIFALWPMEYIVEYGLSAGIADLITYITKVRKRQKVEDGKIPEPGLKISFRKRIKKILLGPDPENDEPYIARREKIPFYDWDKSDETVMDSLVRLGQRSLFKMLRKTPENGELLMVFCAMLVGLLVVFESKLYCGFSEDIAKLDWTAAALVSVILVFALMVASKPYWTRALSFGLFALVFGYGIQAAFGLAFAPVHEKLPHFCNGTQGVFGLAFAPVHQNPPYLGNLFWGPLWVLIFFVIYGAAYLLNRYFASRSRFKKKMMQDQEEPNHHIAITGVLLTLIVLAVLVTRPDFLTANTSVFTINASGNNVSLLLFLTGITGIFCFWWFLCRISFIRWFSQIVAAAAISGGVLFLIGWKWVVALGYDPSEDGHVSSAQLLIYVGAISLAYLYCYTVSAHVSGECLGKAFRMTSSRRPIVKNKTPLKVVFQKEPDPDGNLRMPQNNGELHTYPPKESGVNVTSAIPLGKNSPELSIEETVEKALVGLVGCWCDIDGKLVHTFEDAVKEKEVFIKPNVVVPFGSPYTTDPELVAEVTRACLRSGAKKVCIGEIAISNMTSRMSLVTTGLKTYWESIHPRKVEVILMDEEPFRKVHLSGEGVVMEELHMPADILNPGTFYINMPKMKTHVQALVTLGIKNSHGLVPEMERGMYHQRISQKVVDITKVWMPDLTIIDGYDALEGIGPWPGDRVPLRVLIASNDVVLADLVATQLMGIEDNPATFPNRGDVDFKKKDVKSTWLAYEQGLGILEPDNITRTVGDNRNPVKDPDKWTQLIKDHARDFRWPDYSDEGLIKNIGARFGKEPNFSKPIEEFDRQKNRWVRWDAPREFLSLDDKLKPITNWGAIKLISDEWRFPDLGASVMYSGVFGMMEIIMGSHFRRALEGFKGFVIVYGPLRKPLVCEGAILFGDRAIETEYMVFAPRIYHLAGHGKPPNYYSDTFERLSHDVGGELVAFSTEAITQSRGWYW